MNKFQLKKTIACFLAVCFLLTENTSFGFAQNASTNIAKRNASFPQNLSTVRIPEKLGKVEEAYVGDRKQSIILIQDAHAIPEAQKSIQKLVAFFQKKHGVTSVAIEGAPAELDGQFFKSFPDKTRLKKVFKQYLEKGELTGSTAALIFNPLASKYRGIEDWRVYQDGLSYFLYALDKQEGLLRYLSQKEKDVEVRKQDTYSKLLLKTDQALRRFYDDRYGLTDVLRVLADQKRPPSGSELEVVLNQMLSEPELNDRLSFEVKRIAKKVRAYLAAAPATPENREAEQEFNRQFQSFQVSQTTPQQFGLFLSELTREAKLPIKVSKNLLASVSEQRRMRDIEGTRFFEEFEAYTEEVMNDLIRTKQQRDLYEESEHLGRLKRLAMLKLDQEDWDELQANGLKIEDEQILDRFLPAVAFYENAKERDHTLFDNLMSLMIDEGTNQSIMIAGGFHAQGLTQRFREEGVSYLVIMPYVKAMPEEHNYLAQMRGDFSWKDYIEVKDGKIDLHEAFLRGTRDDLLYDEEGRVSRTILKDWRDQIIRDLSDQGRIDEAKDYTKFLDEIVPGAGSKSGKLAHWQKNINQFIQGLRELESRNEITQQNVLKLLTPATITSATYAGAAKGAYLDRLDYSDRGFRNTNPFRESTRASTRQTVASWGTERSRSETKKRSEVRGGFKKAVVTGTALMLGFAILGTPGHQNIYQEGLNLDRPVGVEAQFQNRIAFENLSSEEQEFVQSVVDELGLRAGQQGDFRLREFLRNGDWKDVFFIVPDTEDRPHGSGFASDNIIGIHQGTLQWAMSGDRAGLIIYMQTKRHELAHFFHMRDGEADQRSAFDEEAITREETAAFFGHSNHYYDSPDGRRIPFGIYVVVDGNELIEVVETEDGGKTVRSFVNAYPGEIPQSAVDKAVVQELQKLLPHHRRNPELSSVINSEIEKLEGSARSEVRSNALRFLKRALRTQGLVFDDWVEGALNGTRDEVEGKSIREALILNGFSLDEINQLREKIIVANIGSTRIEGRPYRSGGVVVPTSQGHKILFPYSNLNSQFKSRERLAQLLGEATRLDLLADEVSDTEATARAGEIEQALVGPVIEHRDEFDARFEIPVRRLNNRKTDVSHHMEQRLENLQLVELALAESGPHKGNVFVAKTSKGDEMFIFANRYDEVIAVTAAPDNRAAWGLYGEDNLGEDGRTHLILPEVFRLPVQRQLQSLLAASQASEGLEDKRGVYGGKNDAENQEGAMFLPMINFYYDTENVRNDYMNNVLIRNILRQVRPHILVSFSGSVKFITHPYYHNAAAISFGGHTEYGMHSHRTMESFPLFHSDNIVHEIGHEHFKNLRDGDGAEAIEELTRHFTETSPEIANVVKQSPAYEHNEGADLANEVIAQTIGYLAGGLDRVDISDANNNTNRAKIKTADIKILVKHGFLPPEFAEFTHEETARFVDDYIDMTYLARVYPQARKNLEAFEAEEEFRRRTQSGDDNKRSEVRTRPNVPEPTPPPVQLRRGQVLEPVAPPVQDQTTQFAPPTNRPVVRQAPARPQARRRGVNRRDFTGWIAFGLAAFGLLGAGATVAVLSGTDRENRIKRSQNRRAESPSPDRNRPWKGFKSKDGTRPDIENVKHDILVALDWLVESGYMHTDVLDFYASYIEQARESYEDSAIASKGYDNGLNRDVVRLNVRDFHDVLVGIQRADSKDVFIESLARVVAREAWGMEIYVRDAFNVAGDSLEKIGEVDSERKRLLGRAPLNHRNSRLTNLLNQRQDTIKNTMVQYGSFELYEAMRSFEFLDWARSNLGYEADKSKDALSKLRGGRVHRELRWGQDAGRLILATNGNPTKLLALQLMGLTVSSVANMDRLLGKKPSRQTIVIYSAFLGAADYQVSSGREGLDPQVIIDIRSQVERLKRNNRNVSGLASKIRWPSVDKFDTYASGLLPLFNDVLASFEDDIPAEQRILDKLSRRPAIDVTKVDTKRTEVKSQPEQEAPAALSPSTKGVPAVSPDALDGSALPEIPRLEWERTPTFEEQYKEVWVPIPSQAKAFEEWEDRYFEAVDKGLPFDEIPPLVGQERKYVPRSEVRTITSGTREVFTEERFEQMLGPSGGIVGLVSKAVRRGKLIGVGGSGVGIYEIPGEPDYVLRANSEARRTDDRSQVNEEGFASIIRALEISAPKIFDAAPGFNFGEVVANLGSAQILKKQNGIAGGISKGDTDVNALRYTRNIERAAALPQEAYDQLAQDMLDLQHFSGHWDWTKAGNLLINVDEERFKIIDTKLPSENPIEPSLSMMLAVILDQSGRGRVKGSANYDEEYLTNLRRIILNRAIQAAINKGLTIFNPIPAINAAESGSDTISGSGSLPTIFIGLFNAAGIDLRAQDYADESNETFRRFLDEVFSDRRSEVRINRAAVVELADTMETVDNEQPLKTDRLFEISYLFSNLAGKQGARRFAEEVAGVEDMDAGLSSRLASDDARLERFQNRVGLYFAIINQAEDLDRVFNKQTGERSESFKALAERFARFQAQYGAPSRQTELIDWALAQFNWSSEERVTIRQGFGLVASLNNRLSSLEESEFIANAAQAVHDEYYKSGPAIDVQIVARIAEGVEARRQAGLSGTREVLDAWMKELGGRAASNDALNRLVAKVDIYDAIRDLRIVLRNMRDGNFNDVTDVEYSNAELGRKALRKAYSPRGTGIKFNIKREFNWGNDFRDLKKDLKQLDAFKAIPAVHFAPVWHGLWRNNHFSTAAQAKRDVYEKFLSALLEVKDPKTARINLSSLRVGVRFDSLLNEFQAVEQSAKQKDPQGAALATLLVKASSYLYRISRGTADENEFRGSLGGVITEIQNIPAFRSEVRKSRKSNLSSLPKDQPLDVPYNDYIGLSLAAQTQRPTRLRIASHADVSAEWPNVGKILPNQLDGAPAFFIVDPTALKELNAYPQGPKVGFKSIRRGQPITLGRGNDDSSRFVLPETISSEGELRITRLSNDQFRLSILNPRNETMVDVLGQDELPAEQPSIDVPPGFENAYQDFRQVVIDGIMLPEQMVGEMVRFLKTIEELEEESAQKKLTQNQVRESIQNSFQSIYTLGGFPYAVYVMWKITEHGAEIDSQIFKYLIDRFNNDRTIETEIATYWEDMPLRGTVKIVKESSERRTPGPIGVRLAHKEAFSDDTPVKDLKIVSFDELAVLHPELRKKIHEVVVDENEDPVFLPGENFPRVSHFVVDVANPKEYKALWPDVPVVLGRKHTHDRFDFSGKVHDAHVRITKKYVFKENPKTGERERVVEFAIDSNQTPGFGVSIRRSEVRDSQGSDFNPDYNVYFLMSEMYRLATGKVFIQEGDRVLNIGPEVTSKLLDEGVDAHSISPKGDRPNRYEGHPNFHAGLMQNMSMFNDGEFNSVVAVNIFGTEHPATGRVDMTGVADLKDLYEKAFEEIFRVLKPGGTFLLHFGILENPLLELVIKNSGFDVIPATKNGLPVSNAHIRLLVKPARSEVRANIPELLKLENSVYESGNLRVVRTESGVWGMGDSHQALADALVGLDQLAQQQAEDGIGNPQTRAYWMNVFRNPDLDLLIAVDANGQPNGFLLSGRSLDTSSVRRVSAPEGPQRQAREFLLLDAYFLNQWRAGRSSSSIQIGPGLEERIDAYFEHHEVDVRAGAGRPAYVDARDVQEIRSSIELRNEVAELERRESERPRIALNDLRLQEGIKRLGELGFTASFFEQMQTGTAFLDGLIATDGMRFSWFENQLNAAGREGRDILQRLQNIGNRSVLDILDDLFRESAGDKGFLDQDEAISLTTAAALLVLIHAAEEDLVPRFQTLVNDVFTNLDWERDRAYSPQPRRSRSDTFERGLAEALERDWAEIEAWESFSAQVMDAFAEVYRREQRIIESNVLQTEALEPIFEHQDIPLDDFERIQAAMGFVDEQYGQLVHRGEPARFLFTAIARDLFGTAINRHGDILPVVTFQGVANNQEFAAQFAQVITTNYQNMGSERNSDELQLSLFEANDELRALGIAVVIQVRRRPNLSTLDVQADPLPMGISLDSNGRLFVASNADNGLSGVQIFSSNGDALENLSLGRLRNWRTDTGPGALSAIAHGPEGSLIIAHPKRLFIVNRRERVVQTIDAEQVISGIAVLGNSLYVTDAYTGSIHVYSVLGNHYVAPQSATGEWSYVETEVQAGELERQIDGRAFFAEGVPLEIVADEAQGRLFISDGREIVAISPEGQRINVFDKKADIHRLTAPHELEIDNQGHFYVINRAPNRLAQISQFDLATGEHLRDIELADGAEPTQIAVGSNGELAVTLAERSEVQIFDAEGNLQRTQALRSEVRSDAEQPRVPLSYRFSSRMQQILNAKYGQPIRVTETRTLVQNIMLGINAIIAFFQALIPFLTQDLFSFALPMEQMPGLGRESGVMEDNLREQGLDVTALSDAELFTPSEQALIDGADQFLDVLVRLRAIAGQAIDSLDDVRVLRDGSGSLTSYRTVNFDRDVERLKAASRGQISDESLHDVLTQLQDALHILRNMGSRDRRGGETVLQWLLRTQDHERYSERPEDEEAVGEEGGVATETETKDKETTKAAESFAVGLQLVDTLYALQGVIEARKLSYQAEQLRWDQAKLADGKILRDEGLDQLTQQIFNGSGREGFDLLNELAAFYSVLGEAVGLQHYEPVLGTQISRENTPDDYFHHVLTNLDQRLDLQRNAEAELWRASDITSEFAGNRELASVQFRVEREFSSVFVGITESKVERESLQIKVNVQPKDGAPTVRLTKYTADDANKVRVVQNIELRDDIEDALLGVKVKTAVAVEDGVDLMNPEIGASAPQTFEHNIKIGTGQDDIEGARLDFFNTLPASEIQKVRQALQQAFYQIRQQKISDEHRVHDRASLDALGQLIFALKRIERQKPMVHLAVGERTPLAELPSRKRSEIRQKLDNVEGFLSNAINWNFATNRYDLDRAGVEAFIRKQVVSDLKLVHEMNQYVRVPFSQMEAVAHIFDGRREILGRVITVIQQLPQEERNAALDGLKITLEWFLGELLKHQSGYPPANIALNLFPDEFYTVTGLGALKQKARAHVDSLKEEAWFTGGMRTEEVTLSRGFLKVKVPESADQLFGKDHVYIFKGSAGTDHIYFPGTGRTQPLREGVNNIVGVYTFGESDQLLWSEVGWGVFFEKRGNKIRLHYDGLRRRDFDVQWAGLSTYKTVDTAAFEKAARKSTRKARTREVPRDKVAAEPVADEAVYSMVSMQRSVGQSMVSQLDSIISGDRFPEDHELAFAVRNIFARTLEMERLLSEGTQKQVYEVLEKKIKRDVAILGKGQLKSLKLIAGALPPGGVFAPLSPKALGLLANYVILPLIRDIVVGNPSGLVTTEALYVLEQLRNLNNPEINEDRVAALTARITTVSSNTFSHATIYQNTDTNTRRAVLFSPKETKGLRLGLVDSTFISLKRDSKEGLETARLEPIDKDIITASLVADSRLSLETQPRMAVVEGDSRENLEIKTWRQALEHAHQLLGSERFDREVVQARLDLKGLTALLRKENQKGPGGQNAHYRKIKLPSDDDLSYFIKIHQDGSVQIYDASANVLVTRTFEEVKQNKRIRIGRREGSDLEISESQISADHANISFLVQTVKAQANQSAKLRVRVRVTDLDSRNGTYASEGGRIDDEEYMWFDILKSNTASQRSEIRDSSGLNELRSILQTGIGLMGQENLSANRPSLVASLNRVKSIRAQADSLSEVGQFANVTEGLIGFLFVKSQMRSEIRESITQSLGALQKLDDALQIAKQSPLLPSDDAAGIQNFIDGQLVVLGLLRAAARSEVRTPPVAPLIAAATATVEPKRETLHFQTAQPNVITTADMRTLGFVLAERVYRSGVVDPNLGPFEDHYEFDFVGDVSTEGFVLAIFQGENLLYELSLQGVDIDSASQLNSADVSIATGLRKVQKERTSQRARAPLRRPFLAGDLFNDLKTSPLLRDFFERADIYDVSQADATLIHSQVLSDTSDESYVSGEVLYTGNYEIRLSGAMNLTLSLRLVNVEKSALGIEKDTEAPQLQVYRDSIHRVSYDRDVPKEFSVELLRSIMNGLKQQNHRKVHFTVQPNTRAFFMKFIEHIRPNNPDIRLDGLLDTPTQTEIDFASYDRDQGLEGMLRIPLADVDLSFPQKTEEEDKRSEVRNTIRTNASFHSAFSQHRHKDQQRKKIDLPGKAQMPADEVSITSRAPDELTLGTPLSRLEDGLEKAGLITKGEGITVQFESRTADGRIDQQPLTPQLSAKGKGPFDYILTDALLNDVLLRDAQGRLATVDQAPNQGSAGILIYAPRDGSVNLGYLEFLEENGWYWVQGYDGVDLPMVGDPIVPYIVFEYVADPVARGLKTDARSEIRYAAQTAAFESAEPTVPLVKLAIVLAGNRRTSVDTSTSASVQVLTGLINNGEMSVNQVALFLQEFMRGMQNPDLLVPYFSVILSDARTDMAGFLQQQAQQSTFDISSGFTYGSHVLAGNNQVADDKTIELAIGVYLDLLQKVGIDPDNPLNRLVLAGARRFNAAITQTLRRARVHFTVARNEADLKRVQLFGQEFLPLAQLAPLEGQISSGQIERIGVDLRPGEVSAEATELTLYAENTYGFAVALAKNRSEIRKLYGSLTQAVSLFRNAEALGLPNIMQNGEFDAGAVQSLMIAMAAQIRARSEVRKSA